MLHALKAYTMMQLMEVQIGNSLLEDVEQVTVDEEIRLNDIFAWESTN